MHAVIPAAVWRLNTSIGNDTWQIDSADGTRSATIRLGTAGNVTGHLDLAARLALLRRTVQQAQTDIDTARLAPAPFGSVWSPLSIFIAPEYYFAAGHDVHILDEADKDVIVGELQQLSHDVPTMLIVAGTVAWKKSLTRTAKRGHNVVTDIPDRVRDLASHQRRIDKAIQRLRADTVVFPAHAAQNAEKERELRAWRFGQTFVARNTAYVWYGGNLLLKYHKRADVGEVNQYEAEVGGRVIFIPGERDGFVTLTVAPLGLLNLGIEVCGDHDVGYLTTTAMGRQVDLHIIVSATVSPREDMALVKPGGYLLIADSGQGANGRTAAFSKPRLPAAPPATPRMINPGAHGSGTAMYEEPATAVASLGRTRNLLLAPEQTAADTAVDTFVREQVRRTKLTVNPAAVATLVTQEQTRLGNARAALTYYQLNVDT